MKMKKIAWMGAGLLLAGVAWRMRRKVAALPSQAAPREREETPEHAALREILERSIAYNDSLYERVCALEKVEDETSRPAAVAELTRRNQEMRAEIDAMRAELQASLAEQGRHFADVDGFEELISESRAVTLRQQKRHLVVYGRVSRMRNVPETPELHAFLKLGFSDEALRHADTAACLQKLADEQRGLMLRAGRLLTGISGAEGAAAAFEELSSMAARYSEIVREIQLYRDDDAMGALDVLPGIKSMYEGLVPPLREQVKRLQGESCFGHEELRALLEHLLPVEK
jgi:cell division protein FtsB